ncbi:hypothetical protein PIB30_099674, partial [Stylosanthes scabra]|nr:hypothetical protein [Stylosanthes scabra]
VLPILSAASLVAQSSSLSLSSLPHQSILAQSPPSLSNHLSHRLLTKLATAPPVAATSLSLSAVTPFATKLAVAPTVAAA